MINPHNPPYTYNSQNRELVWTLEGLDLKEGNNLRGLAESTFGVDFTESDTKDTVRYSVVLSDSFVSLDPCIAIYNRAEIIFGCNPSIFTNFYETELRCFSDPSSPLKDSCSCEKVYLPDTTVLINDYTQGYILNYNPIIGNSGVNFSWYPSAFVTPGDNFDDPTLLNPPGSWSFIGVKSNNDECAYTVQRINIKRPCDLSIDESVSLNCQPTVAGMITLTAQGSYSEEEHLVWNWQCQSGKGSVVGNQFETIYLSPGNYYFTVKDTIRGCWAEAYVEIPKTCVGGGGFLEYLAGLPTYLKALLIILGIIILVLVLRALLRRG